MKRDVVEKRLEEYNDVFVDIFDNLLFGGKAVLTEEALETIPTESFARQMDGSLRQGNRDIRKAQGKKGRYRLICGIENQEEIDNTMPERVMGYDYAAYEEQIREICQKNKKAKTPAIAKRIHNHQRLVPVVTVVLYYGVKEAWERPLRLHDMLEFPEGLEESIKPYVADYPLHVIEVARLPQEARARLTSDFRLVAEYLACRNDAAQLKELMANRDWSIRHPEEFLDVMSEVANDRRYREIKQQILEKYTEGKEEINMCIMAEELEKRGIEKGIEKGIERGIAALAKACQDFGASKEETIDRIRADFSLPQKEAWEHLQKYWKE